MHDGWPAHGHRAPWLAITHYSSQVGRRRQARTFQLASEGLYNMMQEEPEENPTTRFHLLKNLLLSVSIITSPHTTSTTQPEGLMTN